MAFGKSKPTKAVASPPAEVPSDEALTKQISDLQAEIDKLQNVPEEETAEPEPVEPAPVVEAPAPKEEPKKPLTINDVLVSHEQRIVEMEAKWFRLGGI